MISLLDVRSRSASAPALPLHRDAGDFPHESTAGGGPALLGLGRHADSIAIGEQQTGAIVDTLWTRAWLDAAQDDERKETDQATGGGQGALRRPST